MDEEYVQEHILTESTPQAIRTYPVRSPIPKIMTVATLADVRALI
jgi:hypothetical protein